MNTADGDRTRDPPITGGSTIELQQTFNYSHAACIQHGFV